MGGETGGNQGEETGANHDEKFGADWGKKLELTGRKIGADWEKRQLLILVGPRRTLLLQGRGGVTLTASSVANVPGKPLMMTRWLLQDLETAPQAPAVSAALKSVFRLAISNSMFVSVEFLSTGRFSKAATL